MFKGRLFILISFFICRQIAAQDTLPNFSVQDLGNNKVRISWVNPFPNCTQLNVQRSFDSSRYFRTIFLAQSPELPQNGFIDTKAFGMRMYYRIFYVVNGSTYAFTVAKKPALGFENKSILPQQVSAKGITIKVNNRPYLTLSFEDYQKFRDSIINKTKDSLFTVNAEEVILKPFSVKEIWKPSIHVYTTRDGYVNISLPSAKEKKYHIIIFDEEGNEMFQLKNIKDSFLTLDKGNFIRAGWFHFELYEAENMVERNKFYLPKDF